MSAANTPVAVSRALVQCWCERRTDYVALALIRAGQTFSCGRPGCEPISDAAAPQATSTPDCDGTPTAAGRASSGPKPASSARGGLRTGGAGQGPS